MCEAMLLERCFDIILNFHLILFPSFDPKSKSPVDKRFCVARDYVHWLSQFSLMLL